MIVYTVTADIGGVKTEFEFSDSESACKFMDTYIEHVKRSREAFNIYMIRKEED